MAAGEKTYCGKPCPHGHDGERYTKAGECVGCMKARVAAHRESNRESASVYHRQYRQENGAKISAQRKAKYDPAREAERKRQRHMSNPEVRRAESRRYWAKHGEKVRERVRADRERFRARDNHLSRLKKARRIRATPAWANLDAIKAFYVEAAALGKHVDHIIPLRGKLVCGLHVHNNLQLLDPVPNMRKHNKFDPAAHVEPIPGHKEHMPQTIADPVKRPGAASQP